MSEDSAHPYSKVVEMLDGYAWRPHQSTVEPILYHYTDSHGLAGIFESRKFRLSDSRHLNDQREQIETLEATREGLINTP